MISLSFLIATGLLVLGGLAGPEEASNSPPSLLVTGVGATSRAPDIAVLSMGAEFLKPTAGAAQSEVNAAIKAAIGAVEAIGVKRGNIRTTDLSLEAVYEEKRKPKEDEDNPDPPKLLGYSAKVTLRVQLDDVTLAGQVVDAAIKAGVNELAGIWFGLRDDTPEREVALDRAVTAAKRKANAIARAMGVELVDVLEITENPEPRYRSGVSYFRGPEPTVVEPGEVTVETGVEVRYRIARPQGGARP